MKKQLTVLAVLVVVAILTTIAQMPAAARTLGWGYFDALVVGTNPASPTASITAAGAITATSIVNTGKLVPAAKTLAELAALTPGAKGEVYSVSNGTMQICVSSGTGRGAWASPISSTTTCS